MFISQIEIKNFRNFKDCEIQFNEGVNVIIGHNNAGKTNLLKALSLVLDHKSSKRLEADDFNKSISIDDSCHKEPQAYCWRASLAAHTFHHKHWCDVKPYHHNLSDRGAFECATG